MERTPFLGVPGRWLVVNHQSVTVSETVQDVGCSCSRDNHLAMAPQMLLETRHSTMRWCAVSDMHLHRGFAVYLMSIPDFE
jgi:hypothetical protein